MKSGFSFVAFASIVFCGVTAVSAQTLDDLKNDGRNTDNVLTYGMGYAQNRYSALAQINKTNVKKLVPVWTAGLENEFGEQAQPIVHNGVMYVSNARWTVAIDALRRFEQRRWRLQRQSFPHHTQCIRRCPRSEDRQGSMAAEGG